MTTKKSRPTYPVRSLEKTISILDALRDASEPMGVTELSVALGLTVNAVYRHLDTLHWYDLVEQDPRTLKYILGTHLIEYGARAIQRLSFGEKARPYLEQLASKTDETVNLCILRGGEALFIDKIESQEFLRMVTHLGARVPLHCTSIGKAMLAYLPEEEQKTILEAQPLTRYTPNTITDVATLKAHLQMIRSQGYAVDNEEYLPGVRCIAAPILGHDQSAMAAVSVSGPTTRLTSDHVQAVASCVRKAAREISSKIIMEHLG